MKILFKLLVVAILGSTLLVTSCNKYEEGSNFSLLTAHARMVNTWTIESYTINNVSQPLNTTNVYKLDKEGKATLTVSLGVLQVSDYGTWALSSDKKQLILIDSAGTISNYEIVQLKNKDLKVRKTAANYVEVWTLTGI